MSAPLPSKQGELDGLCGIYALTNFLRDYKIGNRYFSTGPRRDRSGDAFWLLLDTAYRLRMLTPDYLIEGYAPHHLVKIWNTLADEADLQCDAILFSKMKRLGRGVTVSLIARCVSEDSGANAIVLKINGHWHLGVRCLESGNIEVADSSPRGARKVLSARVIDDPETDGFVLLSHHAKIRDCIRQEIDGLSGARDA